MEKLALSRNFSVYVLPKSKHEAKFIYKEIFVKRTYLKNGISVENGDIIVDVGANIGLFTLSLLKKYENVHIYAFEPVPPIFECLEKNVATHKLESQYVELFQEGMSHSSKSLEIEFFPSAPGNSTFFPLEKQKVVESVISSFSSPKQSKRKKRFFPLRAMLYPLWKVFAGFLFSRALGQGKKFTCTLTTLDSLIDIRKIDRIDLLKIDVEGSEKDVFEGLSQENLEKVKQIVFECWPTTKDIIPELSERFRAAGFQQIVTESMDENSDPFSDGLPCTVYATR